MFCTLCFWQKKSQRREYEFQFEKLFIQLLSKDMIIVRHHNKQQQNDLAWYLAIKGPHWILVGKVNSLNELR